MKRIDVPLLCWDGMRSTPGYEVPETAGTLAVHRTENGRGWRLTHIPTGRGFSAFHVISRADGIAAAQCLFRACQALHIDLRRRRKAIKRAQWEPIVRACQRWCRGGLHRPNRLREPIEEKK